MTYYLIFDHYYSGIIQSQVLDVVNQVSERENQVRVIAFVNFRKLKSERKKYKEAGANALVLPNFGFARWGWSYFVLLPFLIRKRPAKVVARGVFAANLGIKLKRKGWAKTLNFDCRGAEYAEWSEYFFPNNEGPLPNVEIKRLEQEAVKNADSILVVSNKMKEYWKKQLGLEDDYSEKCFVVPSTISAGFENYRHNSKNRNEIRQHLGVKENQPLVVFSGSRSDWHAMDKVLAYCKELKSKNQECQFLILSNSDLGLENYPELQDAVHQRWLKHNEVASYLCACDIGLLVRDFSYTNFVASPVKYAEYLACGLQVFISENIGDLSQLTETEKLGKTIFDWKAPDSVSTQSSEERERIVSFALSRFTKSGNQKGYKRLLLADSSLKS